ncbi:unnamed protein product [Effrenium voratum]|nr:unnamed protein product [Effrenium voratum]
MRVGAVLLLALHAYSETCDVDGLNPASGRELFQVKQVAGSVASFRNAPELDKVPVADFYRQLPLEEADNLEWQSLRHFAAMPLQVSQRCDRIGRQFPPLVSRNETIQSRYAQYACDEARDYFATDPAVAMTAQLAKLQNGCVNAMRWPKVVFAANASHRGAVFRSCTVQCRNDQQLQRLQPRMLDDDLLVIPSARLPEGMEYQHTLLDFVGPVWTALGILKGSSVKVVTHMQIQTMILRYLGVPSERILELPFAGQDGLLLCTSGGKSLYLWRAGSSEGKPLPFSSIRGYSDFWHRLLDFQVGHEISDAVATTAGISDFSQGQVLFLQRCSERRRVVNEQEALAVTSRALLAANQSELLSMCTGQASFTEQVAQIRKSELIIGQHGGALANILFARPGTGVIELVGSPEAEKLIEKEQGGLWPPYKSHWYGGAGAAFDFFRVVLFEPDAGQLRIRLDDLNEALAHWLFHKSPRQRANAKITMAVAMTQNFLKVWTLEFQTCVTDQMSGANINSRNEMLGGWALGHRCGQLRADAKPFQSRMAWMDGMEALLDREADPNATDRLQQAPLHGAARRADLRAVSLLLRSRADVHAPGPENRKAVDFVPFDHPSREKVTLMLQAYARAPPQAGRSAGAFVLELFAMLRHGLLGFLVLALALTENATVLRDDMTNTTNLTSHRPEEENDTAHLGKEALEARKTFYVTIIAALCGSLVLASICVLKRKQARKAESNHLNPVELEMQKTPSGGARSGGGAGYEALGDANEGGEGLGQLTKEELEDALEAQQMSEEERNARLNQWAQERSEKLRLEHRDFFLLRKVVLVVFMLCYILGSVGLPYLHRTEASCSQGFFWETHMQFLLLFCVTKLAELGLMFADDMVPWDQVETSHFLLKFLPSFLGYLDGYTDANAVFIAGSCDDTLAQTLAYLMGISYLVGVVLLQWVLMFILAAGDPSHACLLKLLHMDMLASCMTLPADQKWVWDMLALVRTFGEDMPQAVLQTVYLVKVKRNWFMLVSVIMALCASIKALHEARARALAATGADKEYENRERDFMVYSCSQDATIRSWNVKEGTCTSTISSRGPANAIAASGGRLYSAHDDGLIREWSLETGQQTRTFPHPGSNATVRAGRYLFSWASAAHGCKYKMFSLESGECLNDFPAPSMYKASLFIKGDSFYGTSTSTSEVCRWSISSGDLLGTFAGHRRPINAIFATSKRLFTGAQDGLVKDGRNLTQGKIRMPRKC